MAIEQGSLELALPLQGGEADQIAQVSNACLIDSNSSSQGRHPGMLPVADCMAFAGLPSATSWGVSTLPVSPS